MNLESFFLLQFQINKDENQALIEKVVEQEEFVNRDVRSLFSHVLNVHHIWNSRWKGVAPESEKWDQLPLDFWTELNRDNTLKSVDLLNEMDFSKEHDEELTRQIKMAQHILKHSVYHRGQIVAKMQLAGLKIPSTEFAYIIA